MKLQELCNHSIFHGQCKTPRRCREPATMAVVHYSDGNRIDHGHRCAKHAEMYAKRFIGPIVIESLTVEERA